MFGRKNKPQPEQGRGRRQAQQSGSTNPAFSYYSSRTPETARRERQAGRVEPEPKGQGRRLPRLFTQVPFLLLMVVALVCAIKILFLSTSPKVVVLGKSATTETYLQSTAVYEAAAHQQLAGSVTNRTKLTVNLNGTATALEQQFPELQAVSMTLPLIGSRPIVYVQVAQPSVVLQSSHGNFALNKSGLVLAKLRSLPSAVPVVVDQSNATPQPGKQYLPSSTVSFIQTMAYQLRAAKLAISTFVLPAGTPYELDVRLENQPYRIRCNIQQAALTQSGTAIATIQHLGGTTPAEYIDVRTPDRAYYK